MASLAMQLTDTRMCLLLRALWRQRVFACCILVTAFWRFSVYGEAYLLQESKSGRKVVVKHVPLDGLARKKSRTLREVEALGS